MERFYQTIKNIKANGADITSSKKFTSVLSDYLGQNYVSECKWLRQAMDKGTHLEFINYKNARLSEKKQLVGRVSQQLENIDGYNKNTVEKIITSLMVLGDWKENYSEVIDEGRTNTSSNSGTWQKPYQANQTQTGASNYAANTKRNQAIVNNNAMNAQKNQSAINNHTMNTQGSMKSIPTGGVIAIVACVLIGCLVVFMHPFGSGTTTSGTSGSDSNIDSTPSYEDNYDSNVNDEDSNVVQNDSNVSDDDSNVIQDDYNDENIDNDYEDTDSGIMEDDNVEVESEPTIVEEEMIMTHCAGIEAPASDFIFPYSSEQYLTEEDLRVLEADEADAWHTDIVDQEHSNSQMAINEILARYGYPFKSNASKKTGQEAYEKFSSLSWYQEAKSYCQYSSGDEVVSNMNSIEKANVDLINEWQKEHGCYY